LPGRPIARSLRCVVENGRGLDLFQPIEKKCWPPAPAELPDQKRHSARSSSSSACGGNNLPDFELPL
jgi:hypothetical protein